MIFEDGLQCRDFVSVYDVAQACRLALETSEAAGQVFNVGSTDEISIRELAEAVIHQVGSSSEIRHVPYQKAYMPGFEDMPRRKPVVEKLRAVTGFTPQTELAVIIRDVTAEFGRKNSPEDA